MQQPTTSTYIGEELTLFEKAVNWKRYWSSFVTPYLGDNVLEVGAGLGGTTRQLCTPAFKGQWTCLEPDSELLNQLNGQQERGLIPDVCKTQLGTTDDLPSQGVYSSLLYIDVIEHIEDDGAELKRAATLLRPGGHLIILVPAHQWLFSPFDAAIGHYRRYNKSRLLQVMPAELKHVRFHYLDSVGLLASSANKLMLRQSQPTASQISTWDSLLVPVSTALDPILNRSLGKSLLMIARKP
jgi:2-polyprenyl-3-methyl-5-hydroxy-6-metoxy-1,4-benzoquinol methylase